MLLFRFPGLIWITALSVAIVLQPASIMLSPSWGKRWKFSPRFVMAAGGVAMSVPKTLLKMFPEPSAASAMGLGWVSSSMKGV